jgi:DNA-directed RNA polymerase subunit M/transcription elongation factor TFIIS
MLLRHRSKRVTRMDMQEPATKSCPKCGSGEYTFRGRKKIAAEPGQGEAEAVETKYRCKACAHEWKVQTLA